MSKKLSEYAELREEYAKLDKHKPAELRKWFDKHKYLSIQDYCAILGKCSREVRMLRIFAGIKGRPPQVKRRYNTRLSALIEVPENWNTREWLSENVPKHGRTVIMRALGISISQYLSLLKKYDIPKSGKIVRNPYCNKAWCHRHYVELGYSLRKCSRLAGVTHPTFADWLIKFGIQIRNKRVPQKVSFVPLDIRKLIHKLLEQEVVEKVAVYKGYLEVHYVYRIRIKYIYKTIQPKEWSIENIPKVAYQYGLDINLEPKYPAHISLKIDNNTVFERDVAIMNYIKAMITRGWVWPKSPEELLDKQLKEVKSIKHERSIVNGKFVPQPSTINKHIMLHYFDHSHLWKYIKYASILIKSVKSLCYYKKKINTVNVIRAVLRLLKKKRYRLPNIDQYVSLFKYLKISGKVLDLRLGSGVRAIACGITGCEYRSMDDPRFKRAVAEGFADFVNLKHANYDDSEIMDLVICDSDQINHNTEHDIEYALSFVGKSKCIMAYVPGNLKTECEKKYKPKTMVKIATHIGGKHGYFFIW